MNPIITYEGGWPVEVHDRGCPLDDWLQAVNKPLQLPIPDCTCAFKDFNAQRDILEAIQEMESWEEMDRLVWIAMGHTECLHQHRNFGRCSITQCLDCGHLLDDDWYDFDPYDTCNYSSDWAAAGPVLERVSSTTHFDRLTTEVGSSNWLCCLFFLDGYESDGMPLWYNICIDGKTAQEAICRAAMTIAAARAVESICWLEGECKPLK